MADDQLFSADDLRIIEAMVYNPSLQPKFQASNGALMWSDEWPPDDMSPTGFDIITKLWVARSFMFHGRDFGPPDEYSAHLTDVWNRARALKIKWPGFQESRLSLSPQDRMFFESQQREHAVSTSEGL